MNKSNLCWSILMAVIAMMMASCGGSVNHSNPRNVADAALECFDKGDYVTLKTLVNPNDENGLKEMDHLIERSRKYVEEHGAQTYEPKHRTFKSVAEEFTGKEISSQSRSAVAYYDGQAPTRVVLVQVDNKWYFERFK